MTDLSTLSYTELQKLAKEKGINCLGVKKPDLLQMLQENALKELTDNNEEEELEEGYKEELVKEPSPSKIILDEEEVRAQAPVTLQMDIKIKKIIDDVNDLFKAKMPRARATLSRDGNMIEMRGGPKVEDITIHQPLPTIMKFAQFYTARVLTGDGIVGGS